MEHAISTSLEEQESAQKEAIVLSFLPLIKKLSGKLSLALPPSLDEGDLINSGIIGLLEALGRYDPTRKVKFSAFAMSRIRGAMIDELRKVSLAPRSFFPRLRLVQEAEARLRQKLQREPSSAETARFLGWTESALNQVWAGFNLLAVLSLEKLLFESIRGDALKLEETLSADWGDPEEAMLGDEKMSILSAALDRLPPREKLLLSLYYYEDLTQKEIATMMNISTVRVSQLHARALRRLREILVPGAEGETGAF